MHRRRQVYSGTSDLDSTSSAGATTIFSRFRDDDNNISKRCPNFELNDPCNFEPRLETREYVDIGKNKGRWGFSATSHEFCAGFYESLKMKRIPNYEQTVHLDEQRLLESKIHGRHCHESCISAQRPLKRYCARELCPMVVFKDEIFREVFDGSPRLCWEIFSTTPRYSAVQSGKYIIYKTVRNAVSKVEAFFSVKETRAQRHSKQNQEKIRQYYDFICKLETESLAEFTPVENFEDINNEYQQRIIQTSEKLHKN